MGLLLSWVYLRGIYGGVGYGAAVLSLLVAAVVFEVVGLVPAEGGHQHGEGRDA